MEKMKIYEIDAASTMYVIPGTTRSYESLGDLECYEGITANEYEIVATPEGVDADYDGACWPYPGC